MRDPGGLELPRGQPRALEQRPRLVDEHVPDEPLRPRLVQRAQRAPLAARRQPARVAVRQRAAPLGDQRGRVHAHPAAALDLLRVELPGPLGRVGRRAHLPQGPGEVRRRGPRRFQASRGRVEVLPTLGRERVPVSGGDPDRRSARDRQRPDRIRHLGRGTADELDLLVRQSPLVEQDDAVALEAQDPLRGQHAHDCSLTACRTRAFAPRRPTIATAIRDVTTAAFGREQEARIVDAIRASENFVPELSLVAELDGQVVGHVMLSYVGLDGDARRVLELGPLSVAPEHQSTGVGGALTREALRLADDRGEPLVLLLGHPGLLPPLRLPPRAPARITPPDDDTRRGLHGHPAPSVRPHPPRTGRLPARVRRLGGFGGTSLVAGCDARSEARTQERAYRRYVRD